MVTTARPADSRILVIFNSHSQPRSVSVNEGARVIATTAAALARNPAPNAAIRNSSGPNGPVKSQVSSPRPVMAMNGVREKLAPLRSSSQSAIRASSHFCHCGAFSPNQAARP